MEHRHPVLRTVIAKVEALGRWSTRRGTAIIDWSFPISVSADWGAGRLPCCPVAPGRTPRRPSGGQEPRSTAWLAGTADWSACWLPLGTRSPLESINSIKINKGQCRSRTRVRATFLGRTNTQPMTVFNSRMATLPWLQLTLYTLQLNDQSAEGRTVACAFNRDEAAG